MQDETIQFRTKESQSLQNLQEQAIGLANLKATPIVPKAVLPKIENIHAKPRVAPSSEVIKVLMEQEKRDMIARENMQAFDPPQENLPETPPSFYHELHGQTMLANVMGLDLDNERTLEINNYILQKMQVGKLEDTKENYEKVLNRLLAKNNLSMNQKKAYLINKLSLYLYMGNDDLDDTDKLLMSILNQRRGKRHGIRR